MLQSSSAAAAALTAPERTFTRRLRVDWGNDGTYSHPLSDLSAYVKTWRREHVLSSTAPSELMLIEGHAAAQLDVTLAGEYQGAPLANQFAPYNRDSAFYESGLTLGVAMTFEVAVFTGEPGTSGWEWWPQFTGVVRSPRIDRAGATVELQCLDNAERARAPVDIAPYALFESYLQEGTKRGGLIDSSSLVDLAGRAGGFSMGPQRWAYFDGQAEIPDQYGPILSVPFHGSVLPEVGTLDGDCTFHRTEEWERSPDPAIANRSEAYRPGPHGYLAHAAVPGGYEGHKKYWISEWGEQGGSLIGRSWCLGTWVYWTGNNVDHDSAVVQLRIRESSIQIVLEGSNGGVAARVVENTGAVATSSYLFMDTVGWHYVQATMEFESDGEYVIQIRVDATTASEDRFSNRGLSDTGDVLSGLATIDNTYAVSDVFITSHQDNAWLGNFTYDTTPRDTARISWGRNRMAYTLRTSGVESFELAHQVAAAEFGIVLFDEAGRLCFHTYTDVADKQTSSVRDYTVADLAGLGFRSTLDSVRNVWTVTTQSGRAVNDVLYDLGQDGVPLREDARSGELLPDVFQIPGTSSKEWYIPTNEYAISVFPYGIPNIEAPDGSDAPGYWDQYAPEHGKMTYTGTDFRHNSKAQSEQKFINRHLFRLWMYNGWTSTVGFVNPEGSPRFRVSGLLVREDDPVTWSVRDQPSIDALGHERVIELDRDQWRQDEYQTRAMLGELVARMGRPIPVSEDLTVPADPRVQVLDSIAVRDRGGFGALIRMQIYGLVRSEDEQGRMVDTYKVEAIEPPAPGRWDISAWDSTLIWS